MVKQMDSIKRPWVWLWCSLAAAMIAGCTEQTTKRAAEKMSQDVYVWQRSWNEQVRDAVRERCTNFSMLVPLCAEVTWQGGEPRLTRVPIDWETLPRKGPAIGVALRIGPFGGPFDANDERAKWLASLASSLMAEATNHQVQVRELQIDFDCAESKLEGYSAWVTAIRRRVTPTRVVITALPSWLKRPTFVPLARAAEEYVLQLHSLERPTQPDATFTLCSPELARQAVVRAGKLGLPFRVALPTYGYVVAFDSKGSFAGLTAEGPMRNREPGMQFREVRSDPAAIAGLVRDWSRERSELMRGIIWYRLPVEGDVLNWSWPTLSRVMGGETPRAHLRAEIRRPQPGLIEFDLLNEGDVDSADNPEVVVKWNGALPVASDGLRGFTPCAIATNMVCFRSSLQPFRIRPQERQMIGWLRLVGDVKVDVEIRQTANDQRN